jgi:hypothetical protein
MSEKFDFSVFTSPRILYTERDLTAPGTAGATIITDTNDLKASRDFLIDYIWIGDDGNYRLGGQVNESASQYLLVNWQIADRAPLVPQALVPASTLQNWWDCDRTQDPTLPAAGWPASTFTWRHTLRWVYNPSQSYRVDWQKNPGQGGVGIPVPLTIQPALAGVSLRTGHRRLFTGAVTIAAGPVGGINAAPQVGFLANPNTMGNISDEPYLIEGLSWNFGPDWWGTGDTRYLNWLYAKISPTQGEPWSDVPIPLAAYGIHQGIARRNVHYKPSGGPILVKAGQSVVFQVQNTMPNVGPVAQTVRVQIALIGRTAAGYGSLY